MAQTENRGFEIPESVLRELAKLDRLAREGVASVPPASIVAEFIRSQRGVLGQRDDN